MILSHFKNTIFNSHILFQETKEFVLVIWMLLSTRIHGINLESKLENLVPRVHFFIVAVIPEKSINTSISTSLNVKYI